MKTIETLNLNQCPVNESPLGLALHRLCIIARGLAWPQEEQGDQRDNWGNACDCKPLIV
jgi:hypothetical protein